MKITDYEIKYADGSTTIPALEFETDARGRIEIQNCIAQSPNLTPYTLINAPNEAYDDVHADMERDSPGYVDSEVWILTPGYHLVNRYAYVLLDLDELNDQLMFEEFFCFEKDKNGRPMPQFELTN